VIDLAGRGAVVVGGAGGIGQALVSALARAGAATACLDVRPPPVGSGARFFAVDVTDPESVAAALEAACGAVGQLDRLVYTAGIARDRPLWKLQDDEWRDVLAVNLTGAFHVLRAATPRLRAAQLARPGAAVVLVASINGERGKRGQANYAASKAGLVALGKTAARELGHFGIRVNLLSPGMIDTAMTRGLATEVRAAARAEAALERAGQPEDVAGPALFLLSDLAAHVTGQVLRVDGGQLIA